MSDGSWAHHLGRAETTVSAPSQLLVELASDTMRLNRMMLPHLDEEASALSSIAPKWVLPTAGRTGLRPGFVALVTVDNNQRAPKILLRSEEVPEATPTRVSLDLDLADVGYETHVTARWDVAIQLPYPGPMAQIFGQRLGLRVGQILDRLVAELGTAAVDALADDALAPAPPTPEPSSAASSRPSLDLTQVEVADHRQPPPTLGFTAGS